MAECAHSTGIEFGQSGFEEPVSDVMTLVSLLNRERIDLFSERCAVKINLPSIFSETE